MKVYVQSHMQVGPCLQDVIMPFKPLFKPKVSVCIYFLGFDFLFLISFFSIINFVLFDYSFYIYI